MGVPLLQLVPGFPVRQANLNLTWQSGLVKAFEDSTQPGKLAPVCRDPRFDLPSSYHHERPPDFFLFVPGQLLQLTQNGVPPSHLAAWRDSDKATWEEMVRRISSCGWRPLYSSESRHEGDPRSSESDR